MAFSVGAPCQWNALGLEANLMHILLTFRHQAQHLFFLKPLTTGLYLLSCFMACF